MKNHRKLVKPAAAVLAFLVCFGLCLAFLSVSQPISIVFAECAAQTINYSDGATYEGEVHSGQIRNGTGTFTWSTGEVYVGEWADDKLTGNGELTWPGLGVYVGEFVNGRREGKGKFTWIYEDAPAQGAPVSFEGTWHHDKIGSQGTLVIAGVGTYTGNFAKQMRSGKGVFSWENGDVYDGVWANDAITGDGILALSDGTIMEGLFNAGVLKKGTIKYAVEGGTATRDVTNGKLGPNVTIVYKDQTVVTGKLSNGEFTGNVTIQYSSGDTYVGALKHGMKSGKGTYTWKSGAHYAGEWANDKMSGTGKYCYTSDNNKNYLQGSFLNGYPNGKVIYMTDKLRYETTWANGMCTSVVYKK